MKCKRRFMHGKRRKRSPINIVNPGKIKSKFFEKLGDSVVGRAVQSVSQFEETGIDLAKMLYKTGGSKPMGLAGLMLSPVSTSATDQPGTGSHGGTKVQSLRDIDK